MATTGYGSKDNPARSDLFTRIVGVGWGGQGLVTVEMEYIPALNQYRVGTLSPPDINHDGDLSNAVRSIPETVTTVLKDDYKDDYIIDAGTRTELATIVWEDDINDIWVWDASYVGANPDEMDDLAQADRERIINEHAVAQGTRDYGHEPQIHLKEMQVAWNTVEFGRPVQGDWVYHTHPNGTRTLYARGYTPLSRFCSEWEQPYSHNIFNGIVVRPSDPGAVQDSLFDSSLPELNCEAWYWYHIGHHPGQTVKKYRRCLLVQFKADKTKSAVIDSTEASTAPEATKLVLKGYPIGTEFHIIQSRFEPIGDVIPTWQLTETFPASQYGRVKRFGPKGAG